MTAAVFDDHLIAKGKDESRTALVEQGNYSLMLARRNAAILAEHGWTAADTEALAQNLARISSDRAAQEDSRAQAHGDTRAEVAARAQAKAFIRRLRRVLPHALRKQPVAGVTVADFNAGQKLGRSTAKIADYLGGKADLVARIDASLAPYFGGKRASDELQAARQALLDADSQQEVSHATLPTETRAVYEAKGLVLEAIAELNACGRNAFEGDAANAALFNKDLLLRARKKGSASDAPSDDPPAGATAAG